MYSKNHRKLEIYALAGILFGFYAEGVFLDYSISFIVYLVFACAITIYTISSAKCPYCKKNWILEYLYNFFLKKKVICQRCYYPNKFKNIINVIIAILVIQFTSFGGLFCIIKLSKRSKLIENFPIMCLFTLLWGMSVPILKVIFEHNFYCKKCDYNMIGGVRSSNVILEYCPSCYKYIYQQEE